MNVAEGVGSLVEDAIWNVSINVVLASVWRNVEIFVQIAIMIANQNASTQNVIENALKCVREYHATNHAKKYLTVDVNV